MAIPESARLAAPLIVRSHVTPWGFLLALPLAFAFAVLGARTLDAGIVPQQIGSFAEPPFWLFGALLIGFALFLFLIGIAELANYIRPSIEVVVDESGVTTYGILGERRVGWADVVAADVHPAQLAIKARTAGRGKLRDVRLQFSRLEVEPAILIEHLRRFRPDLAPSYREV